MRVQWHELPTAVRASVELALGETVVSAVSQTSGFSEGSADRVRTASGRTAFVKAACGGRSAELHRREIAALSALPVGVPAPRLIAHLDDGDWVTLVLPDVAGRHADGGDADAVLSALAALPSARGMLLPEAADGLGWSRPPEIPGLEHLAELASLASAAMAGDHLVHLDLRCDNVLVDPNEDVVIVDWPWASRGAPWIDSLTFLLDLRRLRHGVDCEKVVASHPVFASATPHDITAVLAGLALTFFDAARRDAGPPGLREFQLSEGEAALRWVRERSTQQ